MIPVKTTQNKKDALSSYRVGLHHANNVSCQMALHVLSSVSSLQGGSLFSFILCSFEHDVLCRERLWLPLRLGQP